MHSSVKNIISLCSVYKILLLHWGMIWLTVRIRKIAADRAEKQNLTRESGRTSCNRTTNTWIQCYTLKAITTVMRLDTDKNIIKLYLYYIYGCDICRESSHSWSIVERWMTMFQRPRFAPGIWLSSQHDTSISHIPQLDINGSFIHCLIEDW